MGCGADAQPVDRLAAVMRKTSFILKNIGHPEYSSKKSKRTFSDHAKIGLLIIRQLIGRSYEDFVDMLPSFAGVLSEAGISKIPDPSTLWKFAARLHPEFLEDIMQEIAGEICADEMIVAVDSTGFSLTNVSGHMEKRIKEFGPEKKRKRDFVKTTYSVDTSTKTILSCDCADRHSHDVKRMEYAVSSLVRGSFGVKCVVADKGYDAEHVHKDIHDRLKADAMIPLRKIEPARIEGKRVTTKGFNRGRMKFFFDKETYNLRSLVETVNSMVKRKMGDTVNSRTSLTSAVEVLLRSIAHNFRRLFELRPELMEV